MTIIDQIKTNANYLLQTKNLIREAIIKQGVEVTENTPFEAYPQLVAQIGGVDYRPPTPRRNGTIAGELGQILDTKRRLREVIVSQGVEVPANTPFRKYAELIREIVTTTLSGLKRALNNGTAQDKFPVGTEIEDIWDGQDNPWIVCQYGTAKRTDGTTIPGVFCVRKFPTPNSVQYSLAASMPGYANSNLRSYINGDYTSKCTLEAVSLAAQIVVPFDIFNSVETSANAFFPMSALNVCSFSGDRNTLAGTYGDVAKAWEYYRNLIGDTQQFETPSGARIINGSNYWLRSKATSNSTLTYVDAVGAVTEATVPAAHSHRVLVACFFTAS